LLCVEFSRYFLVLKEMKKQKSTKLVFADVGVTVLTIFNALRILKT